MRKADDENELASVEAPIAPAVGAGVSPNLAAQSVRSGAITLFSSSLQVLLGIASTAILARLLTPADFGLIAMSAPVTAFVLLIRDFGMSMAVAQHATVDEREASALFWLNLKLNLGLAAGVAALAPVLAWFYGEPALVGVMLVLTIGLLALSLNTLPLGLLRREMRFGALTTIEVCALAAGIAVGIAAAIGGLGFWAIVLMQLVTWVIQGLAPFLVGSWRPTLARGNSDESAARVRALIAFGSHTTGVKVASAAGEQFPIMLVGYCFGPGPLGLFQKAFQLAALPFLQIYLALLNVSVVTFSKLRDDTHAYRDAVRKALLALFSLTLPVLAFLVVVAPDVVMLLFGTQWIEMVPVFRIFLIGMFASSLGWATRWVYYSEGRADDLLVWTLLSTPVLVVGAAAGGYWGYTGVAFGYCIALGLLSIPAVRFCLRGSRLRGQDFWGAIWRPGLAAIGAAGIAVAAEYLISDLGAIALRLAMNATVFCVGYSALWVLLPGGWRDYNDLVARHLLGKSLPDRHPIVRAMK